MTLKYSFTIGVAVIMSNILIKLMANVFAPKLDNDDAAVIWISRCKTSTANMNHKILSMLCIF